MSMLALPESERQEILALFRQHLPHVPDAWLQDLAANYGLDAVVDIDPNDVIDILSVPGEQHRIQTLLTEEEALEKICSRLRDALEVRGIDQQQISASLLMIHDSSAKLAEIGDLVQRVAAEYGDSVKKGWAWYSSIHLDTPKRLVWVVTINAPSNSDLLE